MMIFRHVFLFDEVRPISPPIEAVGCGICGNPGSISCNDWFWASLHVWATAKFTTRPRGNKKNCGVVCICWNKLKNKLRI